MYKRRTLRNGNVKIENSRRNRYDTFDIKQNKVIYNHGVDLFVVREFERSLKR